MNISEKIRHIEASPTLAFDKKVKKLINEGMNIINLTVGEPDYYEPSVASKAGIEAIENHFTHYTDASGIESLRERISLKLMHENKLSYSSEQITVSNGAKQAIFNTLFCLLEKGDEVIILAPFWGSYAELVKLSGGIPKVVVPKDKSKFKVQVKEIEEKITSKTKVIIINSPSNPCGTVYGEKELLEFGKLFEKYDLVVVSDEIYEKLTYESSYVSIGALSDYLKENTITINGFSKSFGMTGWRVGYSAAPKVLAKEISKLQSQTTANVCSISQVVAENAIHYFDEKNLESLKQKRDYLFKEMSEIRHINIDTKPEGAFYLFVDISEVFEMSYDGVSISDSKNFCDLLLNYGKVAVISGESFGMPDYIRISFAKKIEDLREAKERIKNFLGKVK